jgi:type II secretory pathway pseudopilin PulG
VELIVVITILAVLATVAFISLTGYSQDAKNSKVASDIRSLVSAIEAGSAKGDFTIKEIVTAHDPDYAVTTENANSGAIILDDIDNTDSYRVGEVDFPTIKQNGDDFNDGTNDYLVAYVSSGAFAGYNVAGQTKNEAGTAQAYIAGNYIQVIAADAPSLISQNGTSHTTGLADEESITTGDLYTENHKSKE